jgi:hypothetical protein
MKRWSMMILPIEIGYFPIKSLVIVLCFAYIKYEIFVFMILIKKLFYLYRNFIFNVIKIIVLFNCRVKFNIILVKKKMKIILLTFTQSFLYYVSMNPLPGKLIAIILFSQIYDKSRLNSESIHLRLVLLTNY